MSLSDLPHVWVEIPLFSDALEALPDHVQITYGAEPPAARESNIGPAQAILASSGVRYNRELFARHPDLRIVTRTGIGIDNLNLADATAAGVVCCNTPDGPTESTAEHTVAMLMALAKRLKQGNDNLAAGHFGPRSGPLMGMEVAGKTLGLVGLGRIGRRVAEICHRGFNMRILAYDPYVAPEQVADLGVSMADLDTVIAEADFLSVHVPVTPETYRLINRERMAQMKDGAFLLNLARGPLVDPEALLAAVDSGKLRGAGIDVFDPEPPAVESRLRDHPAIVATPHSATVTVEGRIRIETMAVERIMAYFRGEIPKDVVNPDVYDGH